MPTSTIRKMMYLTCFLIFPLLKTGKFPRAVHRKTPSQRKRDRARAARHQGATCQSGSAVEDAALTASAQTVILPFPSKLIPLVPAPTISPEESTATAPVASPTPSTSTVPIATPPPSSPPSVPVAPPTKTV
jgi:hypothetical protein